MKAGKIQVDRMLYYQGCLKEINEGIFSPAYLFFGEEVLLTDNLIHTLQTKFLGKVEPEINYFVRYASEQGADPVLALGAGLGLFSDKKLIILKEAHLLKAEDIDRLSRFLENPPADICLVLHTSLSSLYQSSLKKLEKRVTRVNLLPLRPADLKSFVQGEFQKFHKTIHPEAAELLIFFVGTQLADLASQINQIAHYYSEKSVIEPADIEQIVSIYSTQDVYKLCNYIGNRNYQKAVFTLHNLLDSGVSPQQILIQLMRHFSLIWQIQGYYRSGKYRKELIAKELKIYPKYYAEYETQSRRWKPSQIEQIMTLLHKADRDSRDQGANPKILLDILSYQIINCLK
ncbi:MAG: hypothetical protein Kow0042_04540 [Calditrichia bacterium]